MVLFLFLLSAYHFIVIVEAKEPLEIFPICLKHSELQDDKCAILIDFFGAYFWSSGCSQFRQRATKGRHMATKGAMMGSSGIIMANGRPRVVTGFNTYVSEPSDTSEHLDTSEHSDMRKGHKREKRGESIELLAKFLEALSSSFFLRGMTGEECRSLSDSPRVR